METQGACVGAGPRKDKQVADGDILKIHVARCHVVCRAQCAADGDSAASCWFSENHGPADSGTAPQGLRWSPKVLKGQGVHEGRKTCPKIVVQKPRGIHKGLPPGLLDVQDGGYEKARLTHKIAPALKVGANIPGQTVHESGKASAQIRKVQLALFLSLGDAKATAKVHKGKLYPSVLQIARNPCHASKGGGEGTSREHLAAHMGVYAAHLRMGQAAQKIDVTSKAFFRHPKLVRSTFQNLRKRPRTKA